MGITINGRAAAALLKGDGLDSQPSFLNLVKIPPVQIEPEQKAPSVKEEPPAGLKSTQSFAPAETLKPLVPLGMKKAPIPMAVERPYTVEEQPQTAANCSLVIRLLDERNWLQREIPLDVEMVSIGSDPRSSDICIDRNDAEKSHVALRRIGDLWYVIECANVRTMTVNGIMRPQAILAGGAAVSIGLGSRRMIIENAAQAPAPDASKPKPLCMIRIPGASFKHPMDGQFTIGSHPSCKLRGKELSEFAGIVFNYANRLYLHSIVAGPLALWADGCDASIAPVPLKHLSSIAAAGKEICMLEYPEELRGTVGLATLPSYSGSLALLEMNGHVPGRKLPLPASGNTATVGRSADNTIPVDSLKISRKHAQLSVYDNTVMVIDEASGNGTYVGGERITRRMLHPGERVIFADRSFLLCHTECT